MFYRDRKVRAGSCVIEGQIFAKILLNILAMFVTFRKPSPGKEKINFTQKYSRKYVTENFRSNSNCMTYDMLRRREGVISTLTSEQNVMPCPRRKMPDRSTESTVLGGLRCTQRTTFTQISIFSRHFLSRSLFYLGQTVPETSSGESLTTGREPLPSNWLELLKTTCCLGFCP